MIINTGGLTTCFITIMKPENPYYDKNYLEIQAGDLLKVYHFRNKRRIFFMYQIAVLSEGAWQAKDYNRQGNEGHYNLCALSEKNSRVIKSIEIISKPDWQNEDRLKREARKRKKILTLNHLYNGKYKHN